jgi:2-polyprenyl-6-methoxyphenol hydroxylase-like FAD-dependent oxidoreductase
MLLIVAELIRSSVRGEGANHAMQDGFNLGNLLNVELATSLGLKDGKLDVEEALKHYEEEMIPRSTKAVMGSRDAALELEHGGVRMAGIA